MGKGHLCGSALWSSTFEVRTPDGAPRDPPSLSDHTNVEHSARESWASCGLPLAPIRFLEK